MTTDTALHRIIRKLAGGKLPNGSPPFASLRSGELVHERCIRGGDYCFYTTHSAYWRDGNCEGKGWVPEPDIEKACHRVARVVQELDPDNAIVCWYYYKQDWVWSVRGEASHVGSYEEAVLLAGKALLDEKMKEKP